MLRALLLAPICTVVLTSGIAAQERVKANPAGAMLKYAVLGAGAGVLTGAIAGPMLLSSGCRAARKTPDNLGTCAVDIFHPAVGQRVKAAAMFAGIGTGVGLIAGAIIGLERAREIEKKGIAVSLSPAGGGVNVGASVTF